MGNLGTCDTVEFDDFIDLSDPSLNTSGWMTVTLDGSIPAFILDIDVSQTSGVFLPPTEQGYWDSEQDLHQRISQITGLPTDRNGFLSPYVVRQSGSAAMYFPDQDVLWESSNFIHMIAAASDGDVYLDTVPLSIQYGRTCRLPVRDAFLNTDYCEWQGGDCVREISGADNGATCSSTDQLVIWISEQTTVFASCAQHTVDELSVDGGILIPSGTTLGETQDTNFIECIQDPLGLQCSANSLAELVRPTGFTPGQSGYYDNLIVRWVRVLADMSIDSDYFINGTTFGSIAHSADDTDALETNYSGMGDVFNAVCSDNLATNSAVGFNIPITNGLVNDGSPNQPACVP